MYSGQRLRLRCIEASDAKRCFQWLNDPDVTRYLLISGPVSLAQEEEWTRARSASFNTAASDFVFAIEQSCVDSTSCGISWCHIGNVGLHSIDWRNRSTTLGIMIGEKLQWGKKFGTEAVWLACRYAFRVLNLHRVELEWLDGNTRGAGCYTRCGFKNEGVKRHAVFKDGRYLDSHCMSVLDNEFPDDLSAVLSDHTPTPPKVNSSS
ncbi:GNAT family N-acetyltransferase [Pelomyxa schiedti]|nr:GNAT family N-acetyltransferase [Pelomyxa schiedti]